MTLGREIRLLLAAAVAGGAALIGSPVLAAQPAPPSASSAVQDYGACLAGQKRGDLLLLLDESGSLAPPNGSDPQAARVPAAKRLLERLTEWSATTQITLDVAIAGFGHRYDERHGWATLTEGSRGGFDAALDGARDRTQGNDTNYGVALQESLASFVAHRSDADPTACRAIAWFTDGELDFGTSDRNEQLAAIARTRDSICRPGGIADQVRASGIRTFALGLGGVRPDGRAPDFSLLQSISTGQPAQSCGDITTPRPGEFYAVDGIADLVAAFDKVALKDPPIEKVHPVCVGVVRDDCVHRFVLDDSVRFVKIEADSGADGLVPVLVAPDGRQTEIGTTPEGGFDIGGTSASYRWDSGHTLAVKLTRGSGPAWRGAWAIGFVDRTGTSGTRESRSSITIFGDLVPAWTERENRILHADEQTTLRLGIVDRANAPVDARSIEGSTDLTVSIVDQAGTAHELASGLSAADLAEPVPVRLDGVPPGSATMRLSLGVVTAPAGDIPGTVLGRELLDIPLKIGPPAGIPDPGAVEFGTREGAGEFEAVLPMADEGCVWIDPARPVVFRTKPEQAGQLRVTPTAPSDAGGCVAGATPSSIPVRLSVEHAFNGVIDGTIPVTVARAGEIDSAITIDVPFRATMEKPPSDELWPVLAITALLGPGLPLLLLYLAKLVTARIPASVLKAQRFPVRVEHGQLLGEDDHPFQLRPNDLVDSVPGLHRSARRVELGGGVELRRRLGWSPFSTGSVVAVAHREVGASNGTPPFDRRGNARLPLVVQWTWFVLHDPAGPADRATLVLLAGADTSPAKRSMLASDAASRAPGLVAELRERFGKPDRDDPDRDDRRRDREDDDFFGDHADSPTSAHRDEFGDLEFFDR